MQTPQIKSEINTADNGSVVFLIFVNLIDDSGRFLVTVDVVAVTELIMGSVYFSVVQLFVFLVKNYESNCQ
jgi:hypothetical protein